MDIIDNDELRKKLGKLGAGETQGGGDTEKETLSLRAPLSSNDESFYECSFRAAMNDNPALVRAAAVRFTASCLSR